MGATIYTTSSSKEKLAECKKLGADVLINYKEENFSEIVRSKANPDAVLEVMCWGLHLERVSNIWCRGCADCCFSKQSSMGYIDTGWTGLLGLSALGTQHLSQACHLPAAAADCRPGAA